MYFVTSNFPGSSLFNKNLCYNPVLDQYVKRAESEVYIDHMLCLLSFYGHNGKNIVTKRDLCYFCFVVCMNVQYPLPPELETRFISTY